MNAYSKGAMKISGIGIDAVEIRRFRAILRKKKDRFMQNTFTEIERAYCRSFQDPAPHFAGTFAAKEAVQKVFGGTLFLQKIEVRHKKSGKPEVWLEGKLQKSLLVSITHSESIACAVALFI
jgi:holo-[acyl-carrier protein] synthase